MIKLKELLENKKINKIYHVTNFDFTKNILIYDYFRTRKNVETDLRGLSTTSDKNYNWGGGGIKFVLDFKKLSRTYKYKFIDSIISKLDENEILILNDGAIKNAHKYILDIIVRKNSDNSIKVNKKEIENIISDYKKKWRI